MIAAGNWSEALPFVAAAVAALIGLGVVSTRRASLVGIRRIARFRVYRTTVILLLLVALVIALLIMLVPLPPLVRGLLGAVMVAVPFTIVVLSVVGRARGAPRPASPRRALVIGAHPDDVELAAGGTVAYLVDAGWDVHVLIMCSGEVGGAAGVRVGEAERGATFLGAVDVRVHDFPDTRLSTVETEIMHEAETAIRRVEADLILTHSANDLHQDHVAVHRAVLRAARNEANILCFESPSATRSFNPSIFVDVSDHMDVKVKAIELHADQSGKTYMSPVVSRGMAAFRGRQARVELAEGFEAVRMTLPLRTERR